MSWVGWFSYDGNEVINVARVEAYAANAGVDWFRPVYKNDALPFMLGDGLTYNTPVLDDAPWVDEDIPESWDFYGVYPLDVTGIDDSTRSSSVMEALADGGIAGRVRNGTRAIVFNVVLLAGTEASADYGLGWLKRALSGDACGTAQSSICNGAELCYFAASPDMELPDAGEQFDPADCLFPFERSLRKVVFNSGPSVLAKRETSDGGAVWTVQFGAVAGNPWMFGSEVPVVAGLLDPLVVLPWGGNVAPEGGFIDMNGYIHDEAACTTAVYQPIFDPLHPAVIVPPSPPNVPLGNYDPPKNWRRRQFTIPKQYLPLWGDVVPKIGIHARLSDLRNLRIRFYADPFGVGDISDDPCAYCGDIVVSYIPQDHSLILDGADQVAYVEAPNGGRRRADSLVFKTDGGPFEWPALTCGFGYVVTLDLPQTQAPPVIDLSLFARAV